MNPTTVRRPRTMQEIADSVMQAGQASGGRSMEEIAASVLGAARKPLTAGEEWTGRARALLGDGGALGWGDEIEAGIRALGPRDYRTIRDEIRGEQARWAKDNPIENIALTGVGGALPVVGSMALSGGTAAPAVLPSLGARMARGAASGFGAGAVAGAGAAKELEDVPGSAAMGAGVGTAFGAAFPAAFAGARALGNRVLDVAESPIRALAETAPPPIQPGIGPTRAAAQALRNPAGRAAQAVLPTLERRAAARAEQKLLQGMIDDGLTPEQAANRLAEMQGRGAPAAIADVGQENMLELTNVPYLIPGMGRKTVGQFFSERAKGTSGRLAEGVEKSSQSRFANINQVIRKIDAERKPPAKTLYEKAYAHGDVELDEDALNVLLTEDLRGAWFEGLRRSRLDAFTDADKSPLPALFKVARNEAGEQTIELVRTPTVRDIDVIKRGIDAMVGKAMKNEDDDLVRILTGVKNKLVGAVDDQAPAYREARQFWGGQQGLIDALEMGKRFLRGGADDFQDLVNGLNPDELEMYRMGAANAIAESLRRRDGRQVALNILTDPTAQQRLRAIYPDEASFNTLKQLVEDEVQMAAPFARMTRQSQTAQNLLNVLDFATDFRPGDFVADPKSMALRALVGAVKDVGQGRARTSTASQLADLLTMQGPEAVDYLRGLQSRASTQASRSAAAGRAAGRTSGIIGGSVNRRNQ